MRRQIENLRARLGLIRWMQSFGIMSLIFCISAVVVLFFGAHDRRAALWCELISVLASLLFCLREIHLSGRALEIELEDMEG